VRHSKNFLRGVEEMITLGGNTDSAGAVVGGMTGVAIGAGSIAGEWLNGLLEWPRSVAWVRRLAERLEGQFQAGQSPVRLSTSTF